MVKTLCLTIALLVMGVAMPCVYAQTPGQKAAEEVGATVGAYERENEQRLRKEMRKQQKKARKALKDPSLIVDEKGRPVDKNHGLQDDGESAATPDQVIVVDEKKK